MSANRIRNSILSGDPLPKIGEPVIVDDYPRVYEFRIHQNDYTWYSSYITNVTHQDGYTAPILLSDQDQIVLTLRSGFLKAELQVNRRLAFRFTVSDEIGELFTQLKFKLDFDNWFVELRRIA